MGPRNMETKQRQLETVSAAALTNTHADFPQIRASITQQLTLAFVVQLNPTEFRLVESSKLARYKITKGRSYRDVTEDCREIDRVIESGQRQEWQYRYISWCYIAHSCGIVATIFRVRGELCERLLFRRYLAKIAPDVALPSKTIFPLRQHRHLPIELLQMILEHVCRSTEAEDDCDVDYGRRERLSGAALTCKEWYQASQPLLWQAVYCRSELMHSNRLSNATVLSVVRSTERATFIKRLTLNPFLMSRKLNWSMLVNLMALSVEVNCERGYGAISNLPKLKLLEVSFFGRCNDGKLTQLFDCPSLPAVEKVDVGCLSPHQCVMSACGGFRKLQSLSLTNVAFGDDVDTMFGSVAPTLEYLYLYGCKEPLVLSVHFPKLKRIMISKMPQEMTYPITTQVSYFSERDLDKLRFSLVMIALGGA